MLTGVNCVLNFETVIFYISFIYGFFFLWRVQCIFRVVRQINKRGFTWTASKGLRGLTCKRRWTSSNNKHSLQRREAKFFEDMDQLDLIRYIQSNCQAFSNFVDSVCVGKFCVLMSSKLLYPRISRTPNFERFFPWKKCGLYAGKYGILFFNVLTGCLI